MKFYLLCGRTDEKAKTAGKVSNIEYGGSCSGRVVLESGEIIGSHSSSSIDWLRSDLSYHIERYLRDSPGLSLADAEIVDMLLAPVPERFRREGDNNVQDGDDRSDTLGFSVYSIPMGMEPERRVEKEPSRGRYTQDALQRENADLRRQLALKEESYKSALAGYCEKGAQNDCPVQDLQRECEALQNRYSPRWTTPREKEERGSMDRILVSIFAQIVAAQADIAGMKAENSVRESRGESPAYDEAAFGRVSARLDSLAYEARQCCGG